jgi:N-acetylglucosamine-6-sulfatase
MKLSLIIACGLVSTINGLGQHPLVLTEREKPNIVVILTDDQDLHMDSVDYMPLLKKHVIDHGTFYKHHFCSTAICCPSRVTLWTGRNAHNTNVTDVFPPYGEYFQIDFKA